MHRMKYIPFILMTCFTLAPALTQSTVSALPAYRSIAGDFPAFFDKTTAMPTVLRVAEFKKRFDRLFPGFYEPANGQTQAGFDKSVVDAFANFPALRSRYERVERDFPQAFASGIAHFRKQFPGFKPALPIWLVHSLGRMDGGTRTFGGKAYMIFGADVIARVHSDGSIGPFLDHELFHVENGQWFKDCRPDTTVWCSLWQEGTAVYAASVMNPGASDHTLMLDLPKPIRRDVDNKWQEAVCQVTKDFYTNDEATYARYFLMGDKPQRLPHRWGYYIGYRMIERIARHYTIQQIDHFDNATAHRLMTRELQAMVTNAGGCDDHA